MFIFSFSCIAIFPILLFSLGGRGYWKFGWYNGGLVFFLFCIRDAAENPTKGGVLGDTMLIYGITVFFNKVVIWLGQLLILTSGTSH